VVSGDHDIHAQYPAELTQAILSAEREGFFDSAPRTPPLPAR